MSKYGVFIAHKSLFLGAIMLMFRERENLILGFIYEKKMGKGWVFKIRHLHTFRKYVKILVQCWCKIFLHEKT